MLGCSLSQIGCVDFCRALGDTTRQALVKELQREGERCVSDLVARFALSQPTISHHLLLLKQAGLVTSRREGKLVYYAINQENVVECCGMLLAAFTPAPAPTVALPMAPDSGADLGDI